MLEGNVTKNDEYPCATKSAVVGFISSVPVPGVWTRFARAPEPDAALGRLPETRRMEEVKENLREPGPDEGVIGLSEGEPGWTFADQFSMDKFFAVGACEAPMGVGGWRDGLVKSAPMNFPRFFSAGGRERKS